MHPTYRLGLRAAAFGPAHHMVWIRVGCGSCRSFAVVQPISGSVYLQSERGVLHSVEPPMVQITNTPKNLCIHTYY